MMAHRKSKLRNEYKHDPSQEEREARLVRAKAKLNQSLAALDPETRKALAEHARNYRESGKLEEDARRIAQTAGRLNVFLIRVQEAGLARAMHELRTGVLKLNGPKITTTEKDADRTQ